MPAKALFAEGALNCLNEVSAHLKNEKKAYEEKLERERKFLEQEAEVASQAPISTVEIQALLSRQGWGKNADKTIMELVNRDLSWLLFVSSNPGKHLNPRDIFVLETILEEYHSPDKIAFLKYKMQQRAMKKEQERQASQENEMRIFRAKRQAMNTTFKAASNTSFETYNPF